MTSQEHIDNFSAFLTKILNREIELGNSIAETSSGWPEEETIIVFLQQPFKGEYEFESVQYRSIDDPHYWKAEYIDRARYHILACKF
nr:hypothetical protein [uncultured Flavobacterium sp.]